MDGAARVLRGDKAQDLDVTGLGIDLHLGDPIESEYADAIHRGFNEMPVSETTELWCEPGRALVAESSSVLCRVDLRKGWIERAEVLFIKPKP